MGDQQLYFSNRRLSPARRWAPAASLPALGESADVRYPGFMPPVFRPEEESLQLARFLTDESFVATGWDWNQLARAAARERLGPLLYESFRDRGWPETVSPQVQFELRRTFYNSGARYLLQEAELVRLLAAARLDEGGELSRSELVLLKGAGFAKTLYRHPALRPMSDLDLLVRPEALAGWRRLVERQGYRLATPEMSAGLSKKTHYQLAFVGGPTGDVMIELHWGLVAGERDWRSARMQWFWEQTQTLALDDRFHLSTLSHTAALLYACAHLELQHGASLGPLIWLYDIHLLAEVETKPVDWVELSKRAAENDWADAVLACLTRASRLFGTSVPTEALEELALASSEVSARHRKRSALLDNGPAESTLQELRCLAWSDRLRLALAILFPAPPYLKWRYPSLRRLWPLGYPYRWLVVLAEGFKALLRQLRNRASPQARSTG